MPVFQAPSVYAGSTALPHNYCVTDIKYFVRSEPAQHVSAVQNNGEAVQGAAVEVAAMEVAAVQSSCAQ